jgi:hypothetical protein
MGASSFYISLFFICYFLALYNYREVIKSSFNDCFFHLLQDARNFSSYSDIKWFIWLSVILAIPALIVCLFFTPFLSFFSGKIGYKFIFYPFRVIWASFFIIILASIYFIPWILLSLFAKHKTYKKIIIKQADKTIVKKYYLNGNIEYYHNNKLHNEEGKAVDIDKQADFFYFLLFFRDTNYYIFGKKKIISGDTKNIKKNISEKVRQQKISSF